MGGGGGSSELSTSILFDTDYCKEERGKEGAREGERER